MGCLIYGLVDPRDGQLRYVGKTNGKLKTRLLGHLSDVRRGRVFIPRHRWIAELVRRGLQPEIFALENVGNGDWREAEQFWIGYSRFLGCHLLNATSGGDGLAEYRHSEETRLKQKRAALARYADPAARAATGASVKAALATPESRAALKLACANRSPEAKAKWRMVSSAPRTAAQRKACADAHRGKIVSAETRAKLSASAIGRRRSAASRDKQAATMRGRKHSDETRRRMAESQRRRWATV